MRVSAPLQIDGRLDEAVYATLAPMSGFVQQEPQEGMPATEKTELWLLFDDDYVYVVARCWESEPARIIATDMRRDAGAIGGGANDAFSFTLDTFHDRRNASIFHVNPLGGRMDGQGANERQWSPDWNPVWAAAARRFEGGWIAETAVPFKSLRYGPGRDQVWGFNARRINRWKNEVSYLAPIPAARGFAAIMQVSLSATVAGLEVPPGAKSLDVKPFLTASGTGGPGAGGATGDLDGDIGVDARYAITQNVALDLTYNTDFAQVEADEQQINLTRFNLFFPEKREFFLENQGLFAFGGVSSFGAGDTPILFYSRRIGLHGSRDVPIVGGARLTGRVGRWSVGALNMHADDVPAAVPSTNFSVVRVRRDLLRSSSVGLLMTNRSVSQAAPGAAQTYGADGLFRFFNSLDVNTYWARTRAARDGTSYRAQLDYNSDRYGLQLEHLTVDDDFNPEVGFVRRDDMRRNYAAARFSPRPRRVGAIRRYSWTGSLTYIENTRRRVEYRDTGLDFGLEFQSGDRFGLAASRGREFIPAPFRTGERAVIGVGAHDFDLLRVSYNVGQQRRLSANVSLEHGAFYGGQRTALSLARGRVNLSARLSAEPSYSVNWIDLPQGAFATHLAGSRVTYSISPLMFASTLVQYNSATRTAAVNARLRWEYHPGSELFVVYNEQRDTLGRPDPGGASRAVIVKVNRLFRL
ncbi:MAG: carbohydrate binding family 9 domain-containing protein [Acidimicrobiia bacterium]|nr:carbohydrate binding family 9 domain-containing protein [Acidimicrobiia bacterium]